MNDVEAYVHRFDEETQTKLRMIQDCVRKLAPNATERMCMGIPTFDLNGRWLVHFAGFKKHIGFYPDPETIAAFKDQLKEYKTSKGTVQFPLNKPLPLDLIREMTEFRIMTLTQTDRAGSGSDPL